MSEENINVFTLLSDVSFDKKDAIRKSDVHFREYNKFIIELMLSYHADSIMQANEMNMRSGINKFMHSDYLTATLPKRKRFSKVTKPELADEIEMLIQVLGYSKQKALEVVSLLTEEDKEYLRRVTNKGGLAKNK